MVRFFAMASWLACLLIAPARADDAAAFVAPNTIEELDRRLREAFDGSSVVGMQVALVDAGGARWTGAYGFLDKEKTRPVEDQSIFRAGSISKSFTGVLTQMLVEDRVMDLREKLSDAAPEVEYKNKWEATDPVLLVDLAEHTTGWDDIQFSEYRDFGADASLMDAISYNPRSRTSRWRPGRYASYNNIGPAILALVMEKRTGKSFETLIDERIFTPLGMDDAGFLPEADLQARLSNSYSLKGEREPYVNIGMRPAGSLNISAKELAKFVAFLIRHGEVNGQQLVSAAGVERIETPTRSLAAKSGLKIGYGLGVFSGPTGEFGTVTGHSGGIDGFISEYGYFRDADAGFVFMLNVPDGDLYREVRKLLMAFLRTQTPSPEAFEAAPNIDLSSYEGMYRQITPRTDFLRAFSDILDIARVHAKDGDLVISIPIGGEDVILKPLGGGQFVAEGGDQADRVIVTSPQGEMEMIRYFQNAYRRVGTFEAYWRIALVGVFALGAGLAILTLLIWIAARPFGAFRNSNRWRVWTVPILAYLSLGILAAAFMLGSAGTSAAFTAKLGAPSAYSLTAMGATVAFAALAVIGAWRVFAAPGVSIGARTFAGIASTSQAAIAAYLAMYGWIGMTIWSYAPTVVG